MSFFPAYSGFKQPKSDDEKKGDNKWLTNSSFTVSFPSVSKKEKKEVKVNFPLPESTEKNKRKKRKKNKRYHRIKTISSGKTGPRPPIERVKFKVTEYVDDLYCIDKFKMPYLLRRKNVPIYLRPKYYLKFKGLLHKKVPKKVKNFPRYFKIQEKKIPLYKNFEEERQVSDKVRQYNTKLSNNPHDILIWIEYVNFQDEFFFNLHMQHQSSAERERASAYRKLTILDRAVTNNPNNKELQALWLKIGSSVLPSEEMSSRIDNILKSSGGTMTLWLGLMTTTQHSLARCTVPSVTQLYQKLLINFQKEKQPEIYGRDLNVLELLFHYGRFLDHTGHWETLWLIIKVNLQFNTKVNLDINLKVDEKVIQVENQILDKEKQAIWQMWSQLERLREGLHFLPDMNSIDYPQRCVGSDTVVNFIWHFHPDLHFQVMVSFIVLLKVPLLPSTDTILNELAPNALPWAFDSPEFILPSVLISPAVNFDFNYLKPLTQLSRGPQYLRKLHGQEEFLSVINSTFEACQKCFDGKKKVALNVWWLRFERWLNLLKKLELAFLPEGRKPAKSFFKDFLKVEENRNNILYYLEYSLLEFNLGDTESSIKTLKTIISSQKPVLSMTDQEEQGAATAAYRSLCEILIGSNRSFEALDILINLGTGISIGTHATIHLRLVAEKKFEEMSFELIHTLEYSYKGSFEDLFMPIFGVEWISCYFWFIALIKEPAQIRNCYKKIFDSLKKHEGVWADQFRESLKETVLTISWVLQEKNLLYIKDLMKENFVQYPRNLKILSFMSENFIKNNEYWWAVKKTFLSAPTPFSCIFLICLVLDRLGKDKLNFMNRAKNLFQMLTLKEGKLSAMIHCLRLRFLYENENLLLENAQLQALESCPWNKSIYMESILLLPAKLMQLTDVLVEKELRIHITPDEIQEMRD